MAEIFISYRRDDWRSAAWIYEGLRSKFGKRAVFRDVDSIRAGRVWDEKVAHEVENCRVLLAVIDKHWSASEFVTKEITEAVSRHRAIPVLIDVDTDVLNRLPPEIRDLNRHQSLHVTNDDCGLKLRKLTEDIRDEFDVDFLVTRCGTPVAATVAVAIVAGTAGLLYHHVLVGISLAVFSALLGIYLIKKLIIE